MTKLAARLPRSPLDAARGVPADDARYEVDEFRRYNWGASLGGPIRRDRTHFFFSYDQTAQNQPFLRDIRGRGQYDAVRAAFPELVAGYLPNDDGIAAPDPARGRTASGRFLRETDNLILFGKLNHRATRAGAGDLLGSRIQDLMYYCRSRRPMTRSRGGGTPHLHKANGD